MTDAASFEVIGLAFGSLQAGALEAPLPMELPFLATDTRQGRLRRYLAAVSATASQIGSVD